MLAEGLWKVGRRDEALRARGLAIMHAEGHQRAGERATQQSANAEAIGHVPRGSF